MQKTPMTLAGAEHLRTELDRLITHERRSVIEAIAEARKHGDLKENAEYHAAKERQGFIEGRIADIKSKLAHANIIDISHFENDGKVIFGATVEIMNGSSNKVRYQIVGEDEADIKSNKLSFQSPIARAIIGKYEGDVVEVSTPSGVVEYEILSVEYQ
ncbi:MAG: transcription elongation factor GreA [Gammaproteobacteria bacterium]